MDKVDQELNKQIDNLESLNRRQYSMRLQLTYLMIIANKLGLYDAADYIKGCLCKKEK